MREVFFSRPAPYLHAEAFASFAIACLAYHHLFPHHWLFFLGLFLLPDLTFLLYAMNPGAWSAAAYNSAHTYVLPAALGVWAFAFGHPLAGQLCLIWVAHIGFDRMFGMGLKYPDSARVTHLQSVLSWSARSLDETTTETH